MSSCAHWCAFLQYALVAAGMAYCHVLICPLLCRTAARFSGRCYGVHCPSFYGSVLPRAHAPAGMLYCLKITCMSRNWSAAFYCAPASSLYCTSLCVSLAARSLVQFCGVAQPLRDMRIPSMLPCMPCKRYTRWCARPLDLGFPGVWCA